VTVDGTDHEVTVDTDPEGVTRATVDGTPLRVDAGPAGTRLVTNPPQAASLAVHLAPGPRPTRAHSGGRVYEVRARTHREAVLAATTSATGAGAGDGSRVESPMPGRIVRMLVAEGDTVEANATLVIVEAMKMENEVRAVARSVVARVLVAAGDTVDAGQLMCELSAAPEA
jgi:biotin carboxyl carrier protein